VSADASAGAVTSRAAAGARPSAAPPTAPLRSFAAAVALARARLGAATSGVNLVATAQPPGAAAPVLARRRAVAELSAEALRERRDEAEEVSRGPAADLSARGARVAEAPPERVLAPALLDRIAVEARRLADRPVLELRLGADVAVRLTRAARGVELVLHVPAASRRAAEAELPALAAALRARGVALATAEIRAPATSPAGRGPALTAGAPSDTTAVPRQ